MTQRTIDLFVPNEMRMCIIRITSYEQKNFVGYIENPFFSEQRQFSNLTQMLFLLEEIADGLNCPQRSNERRWLPMEAAAKSPAQASPDAQKQGKPIASFKVLILFRQNASWQGRCEWMNEQKSANFRSALELIQLMDGVLSTA